MVYTIDRKKPTPLYEQIKHLIREQILLGGYKQGDFLPTERELCERFNVSRITVRKALTDLVNDGLIDRIQGKGSFITQPSMRGTAQEIIGFSDLMHRQGLDTFAHVLSIESTKPDIRLLTEFQLPLDSTESFIRFRRLRFVEEKPAVILDTYVRQELADKIKDHDLSRASFYELYEIILGRKVIHNEATLLPCLVSPEQAELLQVDPNSAHFLFRATSYVEGNLPVEVAEGIFHVDMFKFTVSRYQFSTEKVF